MITAFCQSCRRVTGHKRALGWGTFFAVVLTCGLWLLAIPFYRKRCVICGTIPSGTPVAAAVAGQGTQRRNPKVTLAVLGLLVAGVLFIWSRQPLPESGRTQLEKVGPTLAQSAEVRSVKDFENSAFSRKYPAKTARSWALKSGGTNFSYSYLDSESDSSCGVELSPDPRHVTHYGISWYGESNQQPATLTRKREAFLRDLVSSITGNNLDGNSVVEYVKKNQSRRYPGGMNTAPQEDLGQYRIKAGVVGSSLIVVLDTP